MDLGETLHECIGATKGRCDLDLGVAGGRWDALLAGSNSVGKSTVCKALDLVLGPERMFRRPVIDEYDFRPGVVAGKGRTRLHGARPG
jgi:predicted ATP-dependent endonuclease of OLD family